MSYCVSLLKYSVKSNGTSLFVQELLADSLNTRGLRGTGSLQSTAPSTGLHTHCSFPIPGSSHRKRVSKTKNKTSHRLTSSTYEVFAGLILPPHQACSSHCSVTLLPCPQEAVLLWEHQAQGWTLLGESRGGTQSTAYHPVGVQTPQPWRARMSWGSAERMHWFSLEKRRTQGDVMGLYSS